MEVASIVFLVILLFLGYGLWLWLKAHHSFQPILERLRHRIQSGLRVAGVKELEGIQENLIRLEQQMQAYMLHSKPAKKISPNLKNDHQEIGLALDRVEQLEKKPSPENRPFLRPRSIEWNGLRFTLSDDFWSHLGKMPGDNLEDDQLQSILQGPFCRVCLKRLVGRDHTAEIPAQCRHCGTYWSSIGLKGSHHSLMDLKRQVYISLDQEFQKCRRTTG